MIPVSGNLIKVALCHKRSFCKLPAALLLLILNKTLEKLFVPVSSLNSAMEQTKKKGTALHTFYQKALKEA